MADAHGNVGTECGCSPALEPYEEAACSVCAPKSAVTPEEESILAEMRAIKEQVRPIAQRLKGLELSLRGTTEGQHEWNELCGKLQDFRTQWKKWEKELEQAIERKLILLGHREPPAQG